MTNATTSQKSITAARIVALALIAMVVSGLGYVRWGSGSDALSVPAGAKAGDLELEPCTYATEGGDHAADCGTLVVPENRSDPRSRLIALPVTRIRARSGTNGAPLLRLDGGPGITNMEFTKASRFAADRDVVLVGYRGVDGSSVLDCPEVTAAIRRSSDVLSDASFEAYGAGMRSCSKRLTDDGVDLAGYSLSQQVDDMEAARTALGYGQIDLLSESAGTRTAMIYAWRYPQSIHRSVMIGVNPPGHYLWDSALTDAQMARYAELCAEDASCRPRTDDLAATVRKTAADLPDRWGLLPIDESNARVAAFFGLFETSSEAAPLNAPATLDSWLSAAEGDASGLWLSKLAGDLLFPEMFTWGQVAAVSVQDSAAADIHLAAGRNQGTVFGNPLTRFLWADGLLGKSWPANLDDAQYARVRPSDVETLLISGELDITTPPQLAALELLPHLPNGQQVIVPGMGHTLSFYTHQPQAGTKLVNEFLTTGEVDRALYKPVIPDFSPGVTQTSLAKRVIGIMIGFALLTVGSLVWMARRVRRRGQFGLVASTALRSVFPVVLGLGGWLLGLLVVLTAMPSVSAVDQRLALVGVSVPVALGIYWAWVHRDWSGTAKRAGLLASLGAGLAGGWLGLHATAGLLSVVTAIIGAVALANLALLVLDMVRPAVDPPEKAEDHAAEVTLVPAHV